MILSAVATYWVDRELATIPNFQESEPFGLLRVQLSLTRHQHGISKGTVNIPKLEDWCFVDLLQPSAVAKPSLRVHFVSHVCQYHRRSSVDLKEGAILVHEAAVASFQGHPGAFRAFGAHNHVQDPGPPA